MRERQRNCMNNIPRDLKFEGFQLVHLLQERHVGECWGLSLPSLSFKKKKEGRSQ